MREMFSTASLFHAAGRQLYRQGDSWATLPSPAPAFQASPVYDFVPATVTIDRELRTPLRISDTTGDLRVFRLLDMENYEKAMTSALRRLLMELPVAQPIGRSSSAQQTQDKCDGTQGGSS